MKSAPRHLRFAAIISMVAIILATAGVALRDSSAQSAPADQHPAQIRNGTCSAPDVIAFNLNPISEQGLVDGTAMAQYPEVGAPSELPIQQSDSTVGVGLQDLIASEHLISVSLSTDDADNFLVCGSIGGAMLGQNDLTIGLAEANGSGYIGVATMHDNGDGTTAVWVFLMQSSIAAPAATPNPGGTPEATPVPAQPGASPSPAAPPAASPQPAPDGGEAQTAPTIEMVDLAFKPNEVTIPADTDVTVTLKNSGALPHNFSITDHNNPNVPNLNISVDVQPGQSQTVTINAPAGDYYFFCNVEGHEAAGMFGTLHVK